MASKMVFLKHWLNLHWLTFFNIGLVNFILQSELQKNIPKNSYIYLKFHVRTG